jgi:HK97 gp10 family phage protein
LGHVDGLWLESIHIQRDQCVVFLHVGGTAQDSVFVDVRRSEIVVTGIKELDKKLRQLEPKIQRKVTRQSMRAGLKVVATEMRSQIPVDSGTARSLIQVRAIKKRKRKRIAMECRVRGVRGQTIKQSGSGRPAFYPAIVEYGRMGVAPNAFGRRTFAAKGEPARNVTIHKLFDGTMAEVEKL